MTDRPKPRRALSDVIITDHGRQRIGQHRKGKTKTKGRNNKGKPQTIRNPRPKISKTVITSPISTKAFPAQRESVEYQEQKRHREQQIHPENAPDLGRLSP